MSNFNNQWISQTNLGKKFGLSAIAIGKILSNYGFKNGKSATEKAISEGYAKSTPLKDGIEFYMWNIQKCQQLISVSHKPLNQDELKHQKFNNEAKEAAETIWKLRHEENSGNDKLESIFISVMPEKTLEQAQIILTEKYHKFNIKRLQELKLNPVWLIYEKQFVLNSNWKSNALCPSVMRYTSLKCPVCGIFDGEFHNYHDATAVIIGQKPCCSTEKCAESEILAEEALKIGLSVIEENGWYIIGRKNRVNRLLKAQTLKDETKRHIMVGLIYGYGKIEVLKFKNKIFS